MVGYACGEMDAEAPGVSLFLFCEHKRGGSPNYLIKPGLSRYVRNRIFNRLIT
jgi:hypothetical protein